jgi:Rad3-related DNA helicase
MMDDLACSIAAVAAKVPGGMLVFFPSYALMNRCYEQWERSYTLRLIEKYKVVYKEPKNPSEYQQIMDRYYS